MNNTFQLDGASIPFEAGQSVMQAALTAGHYIPHLCYHPELKPHGSCKLCTVKVDGRTSASCTMPAEAGLEIESNNDEMNGLRRTLLQMLFAEGNHFCPSCEKSGNCKLQALGYELEVHTAGFRHLYPNRPLDASHPDIMIDFNRCILCELCVRASCEVDHKCVFALAGRGITKQLIVNAASGLLKDTDMALTDMAMRVCPVGAILPKRIGFSVAIGQRRYDQHPISVQTLLETRPQNGKSD